MPFENAIVELNGRTVATDAYGFYSIPSNAGTREVSVTSPGYTKATADVVVSRNAASVQNFEIGALDATKFEITGKAVNEKNDAPVEGAIATLFVKDGSSWKAIAKTQTATTTGEFKFANSGVTVNYFNADNTLVTGAAGSFAGQTIVDQIEAGKEYKVEISKALTELELDDVFHTKSVEVKASTTQEKNDLKLVKVKEVAETPSFSVNLTWADDADLTATAAQVDLITADGKTLLESDSITLSKTTDNKGLTEAYELVAKDFFKEGAEGAGEAATSVKPRLTAGQYFLRVNDSKNAITIIPVTVTEGQAVVAPTTQIKKAQSTSVTATIGQIQYAQGLMTATGLALTTAPTYAAGSANFLGASSAASLTQIDAAGTGRVASTAGDVKANYVLTQTVAGVDVVVAQTNAISKFDVEQAGATSLSGVKVSGKAEFAQLAAGTNYKAVPTSDFVKGDVVTVSATTAAAQTLNVSLKSAASVASIDLTGAKFAGVAAVSADSYNVNNIQVIDEAGKVVAETGAIKNITLAQLKDPSTIVSGTVAENAKLAALAKLGGLTPAKYKVKVDVEGYEAKEIAYKTLYDFQAGGYATTEDFKAIPKTSIKGFIRFAGTTDTVADTDATAEATVLVYDAAGKLAGYYDFGKVTGSAETEYEVKTGTNGVLAAGKYTVIVRGDGFETIKQEVTVTANKENTLNFYVTKGGEGLVKLAIRDDKNAAVTASVTLRDKEYKAITSKTVVTGVSTSAASALTFLGSKTSSTGGAVEWSSTADLSAGDYTLIITDGVNKIHTYSEQIKLADINDTLYKTVTVSSIAGGIAVPVTVDFAGSVAADYIVVKDQAGNVVKVQRETDIVNNAIDLAAAGGVAGAGTVDVANKVDRQVVNVAANGTYTFEAYANGRFVGSTVVTVQDFAKSISIANDIQSR